MPANRDYIRNEHIEFLGKELPINKSQSELQANSKVEVVWLYPKSDTYEEWVETALHGVWETWDTVPYKLAEDAIKSGKAEEILMKFLEKRDIPLVYEIPNFSFKINGLSRAMTHQLVRLRFGSAFFQQSLRVSIVAHQPVRYPESKNFTSEIKNEYKDQVDQVHKLYLKMIDSGVPPEQARNILPIGTTTSIVVSVSLRTLIEYFRARTSDIAQDEHYMLVIKIASELEKAHPKFFKLVCKRVDGLEKVVGK